MPTISVKRGAAPAATSAFRISRVSSASIVKSLLPWKSHAGMSFTITGSMAGRSGSGLAQIKLEAFREEAGTTAAWSSGLCCSAYQIPVPPAEMPVR